MRIRFFRVANPRLDQSGDLSAVTADKKTFRGKEYDGWQRRQQLVCCKATSVMNKMLVGRRMIQFT